MLASSASRYRGHMPCVHRRQFLIRRRRQQRGAFLVLAAIMMVMMMAFLAFAIDVGYIVYERARCQNAADAGSHAAASQLIVDRKTLEAATQKAMQYASNNMPNAGNVISSSDITYGVWYPDSSTFAPTTNEPNAVRVIVRRSGSNGNSLPLFFGPVVGQTHAEIMAEAITMIPDPNEPEFRFLIDDEMIDSDEPSIQALAAAYGKSPSDIISDKNNDGWIDLPFGVTLELPTGQQGDEGMFDRLSYENSFPFKTSSTYTTLDFLAYGTALRQQLGTVNLQNIEWTSGNAPHPNLVGKKVLDPVPGIDPMSTHAEILSLPDPEMIYVSPVFKSDASMAETDPSKYGAPAGNLQGERRGLFAFKILSARNNPAGGSYLPLVTIEVVDHNTINLQQMSSSVPSGSEMRPTIVK